MTQKGRGAEEWSGHRFGRRGSRRLTGTSRPPSSKIRAERQLADLVDRGQAKGEIAEQQDARKKVRSPHLFTRLRSLIRMT